MTGGYDFDFLREHGATLEGPEMAELVNLMAAYELTQEQSGMWSKWCNKGTTEMAEQMGVTPEQAKTLWVSLWWLLTQYDAHRQEWCTRAAKWFVVNSHEALKAIWLTWRGQVPALGQSRMWRWAYHYRGPKYEVYWHENERQLERAARLRPNGGLR